MQAGLLLKPAAPRQAALSVLVMEGKWPPKFRRGVLEHVRRLEQRQQPSASGATSSSCRSRSPLPPMNFPAEGSSETAPVFPPPTLLRAAGADGSEERPPRDWGFEATNASNAWLQAVKKEINSDPEPEPVRDFEEFMESPEPEERVDLGPMVERAPPEFLVEGQHAVRRGPRRRLRRKTTVFGPFNNL